MFDTLTQRLQDAFGKLRSKGRLTEADVQTALREIRRALLEADVNLTVARDFTERIRERAIGQDIMQSLTAGQQVVKIVHDELVALLGGEQSKLAKAATPPTVILLVGLQGAGKTTAVAKLARHLALTEHRRPLLIAADTVRPAAILQLQQLGERVGVPVFAAAETTSPPDIVREGLAQARRAGADYVLVDTAGRLHVDRELMDELRTIQEIAQPQETLLVIDAMTGQDAVTTAERFHAELTLTGVIVTKLDSDTRGGAALTVRQATGCPIKFVGTSERPDGLEPFFPDRMASRILGMGDVLTLIDRAKDAFDQGQAQELEAKLRRAEFTFDDFLSQLRQVRNMGPLDQLMGMIPGLSKMKQVREASADERQLGKVEAIILSMTKAERATPDLLEKSAGRRLRVARGSGTQVRDVNQLLRQFGEMRKLIKQFSGGRGGMALPGLPGSPRHGSGQRRSGKQKKRRH